VATVSGAKNVASTPALRNILPFLAPVMNFFDDYWYYIYHDNNMTHLSAMPSFLNLMYQINKERFSPQFGLQSLQNYFEVDNSTLKVN
jgi:hypothetical protein